MLPPQAYAQARRDARLHVQIHLAERPRIGGTPAHVPVQGRVAKVFRGHDVVGIGDELRFALPVFSEGDELMPGPLLWTSRATLEAARYLEVYLNGDPPHCSLAASQSAVIPALSDQPHLPTPTGADPLVFHRTVPRPEPWWRRDWRLSRWQTAGLWIGVAWVASVVALAVYEGRRSGRLPTPSEILEYMGVGLILGPMLAGVAAVKAGLVPPVPPRVGRWLRRIAWSIVLVLTVAVLILVAAG